MKPSPRAGGQFSAVRVWISDVPRPASDLVGNYAGRDDTTRRRGIETLESTDAVTSLGVSATRRFESARWIDQEDPPYHYQLFLDEHAGAVVASLGWPTEAAQTDLAFCAEPRRRPRHVLTHRLIPPPGSANPAQGPFSASERFAEAGQVT
jgi:hypothetical protein